LVPYGTIAGPVRSLAPPPPYPSRGFWSPMARRTMGSQEPRDGILSQSFTLVSFIISLGGARLAKRPTARGGSGEGVESRRHSTPSEGGEKQRPGSNPGICFSLPNRTPPTCTPRCAMVVPRPPIGRALGATVVHPPLVSAVLAVCRANTGRRGGPLRSEFASEGAPGFAMSVGDMTGPGVDEDLAS
jgi:hypothetical protein